MRPREIYSRIGVVVGPVLTEHGFSSERSKGSTYYRVINDDLSHFILFDLYQHQPSFDIKVFPSSRKFGHELWAGFPDSVGIPSGSAAGLNVKLGVGHGTSRFSTASATALEAALKMAVLPAIKTHAFSYLERFKEASDIIPILERPEWEGLFK